MIAVEMSRDAECLLRQISADLDLPLSETARVLLESALLAEGTRS